jgi:hypothetical protein
MAGRITSPDDEINFILQMFLYPSQRCIDKRYGGIAIRCFGSIDTCRSMAVVACEVLLG